ncbi:PP14D phosphatase, partial [Alectura lathami]|nr:PP14D phosphatase [Alectura lathami]
RKLGKLTIKYNRKDLQRWLDLEEWINAQLQELYQYPVKAPGPEIDLEDLLEVPNEEQKLKLQVRRGRLGDFKIGTAGIIQQSSGDFITELLSRLKGLRRITSPQK